MATYHPYSTVEISIKDRALLDPVQEALTAAFPELPADHKWIAFSIGSGARHHMEVCLHVLSFNQSQIGDIRQKAFEVVRKLMPGLTPKDVTHSTGTLVVPGRY